ncbi:CWF19-like protein 1-like, partial [Durusdinium trenchii]
MAELNLEVLQKRYKWTTPTSEPTVQALKDHIGERSKGDSQLHSYHQKLRFRSEAKALENDDLVPVAPAIVQVLGPGSVVHMFGLFCDRDGKPLPKVPKSSPSTSATPAPRPAPLTVPTYGSGAVGPSYGYGPQAPQDMLMLTNSWSPPYNQPQSQEDHELSEALKASRAAFQADEEAQLRWALEESAMLAEQEQQQREESARLAAQEEEIKKFYMQDMQKKSKAQEGFDSHQATLYHTTVVDREAGTGGREDGAPNNCIGPEVGSEDALTVFFAALNNALQKLLGRPLTSEDRIFHFDPERNRASLELPNLRPPQQLSCAVEMDAEDVQF